MGKWIGIMASDPNGLVGVHDRLPWYHREDLEYFRDTTEGQVMLMGSKTYHSLPVKIRKNRLNIVLTRSVAVLTQMDDELVYIPNLDCLDEINTHEKHCYMIGGGQMMTLCLQAGLLDIFLLTLMTKTYEGDAYIPLHLLSGWRKTVMLETSAYQRYRLERV